MSIDVVGIVSGFFVGIAASYFVWIPIARAYLPRVFVSEISRAPERGHARYRIAVLNLRRHNISDITSLAVW